MSNGRNKDYLIIRPGLIQILHGPVSMHVMADRQGEPLTDLCIEAFEVIDDALRQISRDRSFLRSFPFDQDLGHLQTLSRRMCEVVLAVGEPTLTPMAAVAGVISDAVADWLRAQGATRAVANNGGDIAIRLAKDEAVKIGLVSNLASGEMDLVVNITSECGIGGIATSGAGGRSLTRGIAQGVSAFSSNCAMADALATHLANCTFIESPRVIQKRAAELDPTSDIKDLDVVVEVGALTEEEVARAFAALETEITRQTKQGNLLAAHACIQQVRRPYGSFLTIA